MNADFFKALTSAYFDIERGKLEATRQLFTKASRIIFIGNGGSAAIASHQAIDFTKNGNKTAIAFNDSAALLCLANDYGFEQVFAKSLEHHAQEGDVLVAISASGRSPNILNAVAVANEMELDVVTLSGFDADNPLRSMGFINHWIDSHDYGVVELTCEAILHSMIGVMHES